MRTMYDSVSPGAIPVTAQLVAGYVDGRYAWSAADWARFPNSTHVRIAVFPSTNDGVVLDVEPGDATPVQAPGWVQMRRAAGVDPTVYCSLTDWPAVRRAFAAAGVPEPHYWIAAYPGNGTALYDGAVAHQYADPPGSGGNYDLSAVADFWPGVDPEGDDMDPLELLNYPIKREGAGQTGTTSLLAMAAWSDKQITDMHADIANVRAEVDAKVSALAAQVVTPNVTVDIDALAAKVAALLKNAIAAEFAERLGADPNPND